MSLDVYLRGPVRQVKGECTCSECGTSHTFSREQADYFFEDNITHNLVAMADTAGIYETIWKSGRKDSNIQAKQLIAPLKEGLAKLLENPQKFKAFNPDNGWGNYEVLVEFAQDYLAACEEFPESIVEARG